MSFESKPFRDLRELRIDYAQELNPAQFAAACAPPGPALVIAGAGSGKTRTLTYRVAYLLEQGIAPDRILLLTFTNKAAGEMMRRVSALLGDSPRDLWGGTFHSIANRILRRHTEQIGFREGFTIIDRADADDLVDTCRDEAGSAAQLIEFPKASLLGSMFSMAANTRLSIQETVETHYRHFAEQWRLIEAIEKVYRAKKLASRVVDFDDLLVFWLQLLESDANSREAYQRRFQFLLVDEYQDTNRIQADIVDLLAARNHNVMAVGDDAQSIYSWRGAEVRNMLDFPKRHPGTQVYKIETNYRSTPEILTVANHAIAANRVQFDKQLQPIRTQGIRPVIVNCYNSSQEASHIADRIRELRDEGISFSEIAVLYRAHFHALDLQLTLAERGIPFLITSGLRFFETAHVKDLTAYLRLVVNPRDSIAFRRVAGFLDGVGPKTAAKIGAAFLAAVERGLTESLSPNPNPNPNPNPQPSSPAKPEARIARALESCRAVVPKKAGVEWAQLAATFADAERLLREKTPADALTAFLQGHYLNHLRSRFQDADDRAEELHELIGFAIRFKTADDFLNQISLLGDTDTEGEAEAGAEADASKNSTQGRVRLSTVHQAKGLEFAAVFVISLCDGLFPSKRTLESGSGDGLEEERRLFYVALTRAKNELVLSYPTWRDARGGPNFPQKPSRFLNDIPSNLLEYMDVD